ncbi:hypothetical protein CROQUDRAFT_95445 [Cronartium quercuum f. sp. fusiforme G11]|uniref:Uncharacterized protein n=1 Tax=Cronartium quercuum f. sp. fusiforme G11 TaxID=708437 RepID=A0A9P6T9F1_9BASI|nr:hypothetical protein CROQUDRAFT_95445 [Cronartium quercuum f. sp. fusiforme G11]
MTGYTPTLILPCCPQSERTTFLASVGTVDLTNVFTGSSLMVRAWPANLSEEPVTTFVKSTVVLYSVQSVLDKEILSLAVPPNAVGTH